MDWFDFFMGICIGASLCEEEYENALAQNNREIYDKFDEDAYEQFLFEKRYMRDLK